jgi:hypothetical protein
MSKNEKNMKETKITLYEYFRSIVKHSKMINKDYLRKFDTDNSYLLEAAELAAVF